MNRFPQKSKWLLHSLCCHLPIFVDWNLSANRPRFITKCFKILCSECPRLRSSYLSREASHNAAKRPYIANNFCWGCTTQCLLRLVFTLKCMNDQCPELFSKLPGNQSRKDSWTLIPDQPRQAQQTSSLHTQDLLQKAFKLNNQWTAHNGLRVPRSAYCFDDLNIRLKLWRRTP